MFDDSIGVVQGEKRIVVEGQAYQRSVFPGEFNAVDDDGLARPVVRDASEHRHRQQ